MRVPRFILVLVLVGVTGFTWWRLSRRSPRGAGELREIVARPIPQVPDEGYITSNACRDCHPDQHASWHRTFHRTMTQALTPETMLAPLDEEVTLTTRGRASRLWRDDDKYWIDMIDPDWDMQQYRETGLSFADGPRSNRQIVMATGSHHIQTYWVNGRRGNQLHQVPWAYHLTAQRWIPLPDIFILPPDSPANLMTTWNEVCIQCHAVRGQPGFSANRETFDSTVTELGIACEACHGPGGPHRQRIDELSGEGITDLANLDLAIVNPASLPHEASAHVCGQCHSDFMIVGDEFWQTGHAYRPGEDLLATRAFPEIVPGMAAYWDDGTVRVGGREFTAMEASGCYVRGEMSCLSCHSMHRAEPNDQLTAGMETDQACLQCHSEYADRIEEHSHHPAESSGARCYNCHMPYTSFALMKTIRSHRVDSPSAQLTAKTGRPNACNQCHLDQSLAWTAGYLSVWYGQEPLPVEAPREELAQAVELLLAGDAVQRAVTAANFGRSEAQEASGDDWQPGLLAQLLDDPYAVVRFAAGESLRQYPGFEDFDYDFLAPPDVRSAAAAQAIKKWSSAAGEHRSVLIDASGRLDTDRLRALQERRDDRPISLPE